MIMFALFVNIIVQLIAVVLYYYLLILQFFYRYNNLYANQILFMCINEKVYKIKIVSI